VRPGSRGRITAALLGLLILVLAGWFIREQVTDSNPPAPPAPTTTTTTPTTR